MLKNRKERNGMRKSWRKREEREKKYIHLKRNAGGGRADIKILNEVKVRDEKRRDRK